MAIAGVRYGHTNLVARDWRRLASFYEELFGCTPVPPERDYRSSDLDRGTALIDAHLTGVHLRLPGPGSTDRRSRSTPMTTSSKRVTPS